MSDSNASRLATAIIVAILCASLTTCYALGPAKNYGCVAGQRR